MKAKNLICSCILLITFGLIATSYADISLSTTGMYFRSGGKMRKDISVMNLSKTKIAYVTTTTTHQVERKGKTENMPIHNPLKAGILVTPQKFAIPAGQNRIIRVVLTKYPAINKQEYFRIAVVPAAARLVRKKQKAEDGGTMNIVLRVRVGYGVKVVLLPKNEVAKYSYDRKGKQFVFKNKGNVDLIYSLGQKCVNGSNCDKTYRATVKPGVTKRLSLKYNAPLTIFLKKPLQSDWQKSMA